MIVLINKLCMVSIVCLYIEQLIFLGWVLQRIQQCSVILFHEYTIIRGCPEYVREDIFIVLKLKLIKSIQFIKYK